MTVYSFYIFDRHTECIYHKSWLPAPPEQQQQQQQQLPPQQPQHVSQLDGGAPAAPNGANGTTSSSWRGPSKPRRQTAGRGGDDAKLVFGTVFSLRNMVRKLGGDDDAFISFRTAQYKLHYYETPSSLRFVMLTDTGTLGMRNVLHQIYINLWVEYVVKNPLSPVEHKGGEGVENELFELGLDQFVRGLM